MKSLLSIRILYSISAAYDGFLGLGFLLAAPRLFALTGITPPNHWGYIHFAARLLVIFGWMFLQIARNPIENFNIVIYGVLLKTCYVTTVLWHYFHGGIPEIWIWFAGFDFVFLLLFLWSWGRLRALARG